MRMCEQCDCIAGLSRWGGCRVVCCVRVKDCASMHAPHNREWLTCLNDLQVQCSFSPLVRFQVGYTIVAKLALGKKGKEVRLQEHACMHALSTVRTCVQQMLTGRIKRVHARDHAGMSPTTRPSTA